MRLRALFESSPDRILTGIESDPAHAAFRQSFREYLDAWGFRCSGELMLTVPSFQERPADLLDLVRTYAMLDAESPDDQLARQAGDRRRATAAVAREILGRRRFPVPLLHSWTIVSIVLRCTQRAITLRERARLKQALLYSRLRHVALAIGSRLADTERLEKADDVFFLTAEEIDELASGTAMFPEQARGLVSVRRAEHERFLAMTPPDAMTLSRGAYWSPLSANDEPPVTACVTKTTKHLGDLCDGRRQLRTEHDEPRAANSEPRTANSEPRTANSEQRRDRSLAGLGACGGVTTARAAILADISEAGRLAPGDVLVTRQTDPGWGPLFPLVSGLVIERGGMLSHGAIIAREFGIPSVVGVEGATTKIRHGCTITVDGDRGLVRLHDAQEA
jgi:pyruvate,water dikinase